MTSNIQGDEGQSIRRHLLGGGIIALLLTAGVGGWAASTELSGAVIASGSVVVDSNVKKVQHLTGGIVGQLLVRDGSRVRAGDVVVRLDETIMRANLAIVVKGLDEMEARQARLAGERDRADKIELPAALLARQNDPDVARAIASERKLFDLRRSARAGQKAQLQERINQLEEEVRAHTALQQAKAEEIELIQRELDGVRTLWNKNLVQLPRLTALEREAVRLKGERAQSFSAAAQARGKITETELQIIQIDQDLSSEVAKELREVDMKIGEFIERQVTAEDQLKHVEIRAPQDGVVHQLAVHTVGGVVTPADPIMLIVPQADVLAVEAKVSPQDIDQLHVGQAAGLRFSAFNQRTTPEISGAITRISADVSQDQRSGQSHYVIRI
jgi:HlyD family secretion protein